MPDMDDQRLLTPGQRKLVGFTLGFIALILTLALLGGVFWVLGQAVSKFSSILWPIAVAGILALMLRPIVELLEVRLKLKRLAAVMVLYGLFVLTVAACLLVVTPPLLEQIFDFIAFVPTFWNNALQYIQDHYPEWVKIVHHQLANPTVKDIVENVIAQGKEILKQALPSLKNAGLGAIGIFGFATHLAIIPIYLFFFLLSRRDPTRQLDRHLSFVREPIREDIVFLVNEFITIIVSFFRGQLLIGLIMGGLLATGFMLVGLKFGLIIGLALGILNIVPYLGTMIGLSIALPLAVLQPNGGWNMVGLVLLVFVIVQNIEGWYLTPKIMGQSTGLHPVVVIIAIFFWGTALDGLLGMILAIPLTAFFVTAWRLAKRKYLNSAEPEADKT